MIVLNTSQKLSLLPGQYIVQLWGAQGGAGMHNKVIDTEGGRGAYVSAVLSLKKSVDVFVNIGLKGSDGNETKGSSAAGGWNGGGNGGRDLGDDDGAGAGGGSTDLRIGENKIENRFMVAAGGSGSTARVFGAPGGDSMCYTMTEKYNLDSYRGDESGCGDFWKGEDGKDDQIIPSSGAGGGFRGGKAVESGDDYFFPTVSYSGSSFISGHSEPDPVDEILNNFEIKILSPKIRAGFENFPSFSGSIEKGHIGNGCACFSDYHKPNKNILNCRLTAYVALINSFGL